jgi:predicted unusual protein kinase regulating ubiquinone biosynthesis (AarF/ABC1/UbiB family)
MLVSGLMYKVYIAFKVIITSMQDLSDPAVANAFVGHVICLGVVAIKTLQYFASIHSTIPEALKDALKDTVLMNIPPHPLSDTLRVLDRYALLDKVVLEHDTPIGSGSVAQVYMCTYNGIRSVVKIRHPNVLDDVQQWRCVLHYICTLIGTMSGYWMEAEEIIVFIHEQCDLNQEGTSMTLFRKLLAQRPDVAIPSLLYVQSDVLIMSLGDGSHIRNMTISNIPSIDLLFASFLYTSCIHGVAHGDLHSGNFLVSTNNRICLLDFGLVLTVDKYDKNPIVRYMYAKLACKPADIKRLIESITLDMDISDQLIYKVQAVFRETKYQGAQCIERVTELVNEHGCQLNPPNLMYLVQCILIDLYYPTKRKYSNLTYALQTAASMCTCTGELNWIRAFQHNMMSIDIQYKKDV